MKLSKRTLTELKKLGVNTSEFTDSVEYNGPAVIKKAPTSITKERKTIFTVLKTGAKFKEELKVISELLLFEGDTFELLGEDFKYIEGSLYRKVRVIKSWMNLFEGKIGWIEISETDAPKDVIKKRNLIGQFMVVSESLSIRDCSSLDVISTLTKGDTVDFDDFNDAITLEDCILRKVFIRNSEDEDLKDKKVWMPVMYINKNESVGIYNTEFTINNETELDVNFDGEEVYKLYKGDTFIFTKDCMTCVEGMFFKEVEIHSSRDEELVGKKGWIELRNSNALRPTVHLVSNNEEDKSVYNEKRDVMYEDFVLPRDIIGYEPNCTFVDNDNTVILDKGRRVTVLKEFDSKGRILIQCKEYRSDGSTNLVDYAVSRFVLAS